MQSLPLPVAPMMLTQLGLGYLYTAALRAVTELDVATVLADGPKSVAALAAATGAEPVPLGRMLRALASCGVFAQADDGRYHLTEAAALLRSDQSPSMRDAVLMMTSDPFLESGIHLRDALRYGQNVFSARRGVSFFAYLQATPDAAAVFHAGMANFAATENPPIAGCCDLPDNARVVDVGGGYGGFLQALLAPRPSLRGVLYDLPEVLCDPARLELGGVSDRCEVVAGDFFDHVPPGGDVYILKRVLHDWDDEQCGVILRQCRDALGPDGRLLIIDAVVGTDNAPSLVKGIDLLMLAASDGRERTAAEFSALLADAGLVLGTITPTPSLLSIIEARRA